MTPAEFQGKWAGHQLTERAACQEHFLDLCAMLGQPTPASTDAEGVAFCFEKRVTKLSGGQGYADVWKRGCFGWEYKQPGANLAKALAQLSEYAVDLENPPLLVVSDTQVIQVHTNFTGTARKVHEVRLDTIDTPASQKLLRAVFHDPVSLRPTQTPADVTEEAARNVAAIAEGMRRRRIAPHDAAHFLMRLLFCLFAEDVDLLPEDLFGRILGHWRHDRGQLANVIGELFRAMATGGRLGMEPIPWFNGGLFDDDTSYELDPAEISLLMVAARRDWSQVDASIFGTLFERALDPAKRAQLGAHYTSRADIVAVIEPVLMAPLRAAWAELQAAGDQAVAQVATLTRGKARDTALAAVSARAQAFCEQLGATRVLDPACGSGNFLYVSLTALLELEHEVRRACARWKCRVPAACVSPAQILGLEIDEYAAELAQLSVWIGYLQFRWVHNRGEEEPPILRRLDTIRRADAVLGPDGAEPSWPEADVIVGNPPFLGDKKQRTELGEGYVRRLRALYEGRVPSGADLCCYWFERARTELAAGRAKRAGLLATNSIRQGKNRAVLDRIAAGSTIFMAWADRPWVLAGAAVRIAIIGFNGAEQEVVLDGRPVAHINPDLTSGADVTKAVRLAANAGVCSFGLNQAGPFDLTGDEAQTMLAAPRNPNGRTNSDVVHPYLNGADLMRRRPLKYVIDFHGLDDEQAAYYELPFERTRRLVRPLREHNRDPKLRRDWWLHQRPRPGLRQALFGLERYLVTPEVAKHRVFAWVDTGVLPDHQLLAFARQDDFFFGVLHSRVHEVWALRQVSWLGKGNAPRYTPTTCFETFPFPAPDDGQRAAVAAAARRLHETRQSALEADARLTLTALYNRRPTWLANLHAALDAAVRAAYGWPQDIDDAAILLRLLALNGERAAEERTGLVRTP